MHPNFWLIIICAVIAITIAIVMNKKKVAIIFTGGTISMTVENW